MHTVLLDMKLPKVMLLNVCNPLTMETILKASRDLSKEDDQMVITSSSIISPHPPAQEITEQEKIDGKH